mmetsp:Transcript_26950/g.30831  ORF Transcript_26950/g.30831 Transcript_26950/m.30831 type:complete len:147 (+) Transcript_26950:226-666(+)
MTKNLSNCYNLDIQHTPTQLKAGLTAQELEAVIMKGRECEKGECSIGDVDMLLAELMEQQHLLSDRVKELDNMIKSLEVLNTADGREVDEVRETVRAIFRIFQMGAQGSGNDYPTLSKPTGYSGEVGSGPTDAYKALNPKPWKSSP